LKTVPFIFPAALASLLTLSACTPRETAVEAGVRTATLEISNGGEPGELDPHVINASPDYQVVPALFEGLLNFDPATLAPTPGVAERWTVSTDGRTYTFTLRPNAKWSNGDPLTSADFLYSFRRALSPALGSQYTLLFDPVRGAADYAAAKLTDFSAVGFATPDPHTVVITLAHPTPYFLGMIAGNPVWFPVHRPTIERHGRIDQRGTGWTRAGHLVGNGAFTLKEWRPNQFIVAEKNPHYWDAAHVRVQTLRIHAIDSLDVEERSFRAGQLHVAHLPLAKANVLFTAKSPLLTVTPGLNSRFINVNTTRPALNDARVRRALSLALDLPHIVAHIDPAGMIPADGIVPTGMAGYSRSARVTADPSAARALLAAAGFPGGAGFPKLELCAVSGSSLELPQAIQQAWRTELGLRIEIITRESRTHWDQMHAKNYDLALAGWNADYPDASTFLDLWKSGGGWNFTHWADARYDALLAQSATTLDPATRLTQLQACEAHLLEEMPVIPIAFSRFLRLVHPSVRGWVANSTDRPDYRTIWLAAP
jgi:oligopeptide transport system substrate-binding protein